MPSECKIIFEDNPDKVFYGGQLLSGHVEIIIDESKTAKGNIFWISSRLCVHSIDLMCRCFQVFMLKLQAKHIAHGPKDQVIIEKYSRVANHFYMKEHI